MFYLPRWYHFFYVHHINLICEKRIIKCSDDNDNYLERLHRWRLFEQSTELTHFPFFLKHNIKSLAQCFSTGGPRTPGGPRNVFRGSVRTLKYKLRVLKLFAVYHRFLK